MQYGRGITGEYAGGSDVPAWDVGVESQKSIMAVSILFVGTVIIWSTRVSEKVQCLDICQKPKKSDSNSEVLHL